MLRDLDWPVRSWTKAPKLLALGLPAIGGDLPTAGQRRRLQAQVLLACLREPSALRPLTTAAHGSALQRAISAHPAAIGVLAWPYVHAKWSPADRVAAIAQHHALVDQAFPALALAPGECRVVAELPDVMPGLQLMLDRPTWFQREGELVLNLNLGETRLFSVAWLIRRERVEEAGAVEALIGAVQGSSAEGTGEIYRDLTKALHGLRPRDFLLDALRLWCQATGVQRLRAVDDASRHHRHAFFGPDTQRAFPTDYDALWVEQGGVHEADGTFSLPMDASVRDLESVPSKKRSMYRKRQALLDALQADMSARCQSGPVGSARQRIAAPAAPHPTEPSRLRRWAARAAVVSSCATADAVFALARLG